MSLLGHERRAVRHFVAVRALPAPYKGNALASAGIPRKTLRLRGLQQDKFGPARKLRGCSAECLAFCGDRRNRLDAARRVVMRMGDCLAMAGGEWEVANGGRPAPNDP
jgi:hypothetical protein